MTVQDLTSVEAFRELIKSDKLVIVYAWTPQTEDQGMFEIVEGMSQDYTDAIFAKVNADAVHDIFYEVSDQILPTFLFYKNGQKVDEVRDDKDSSQVDGKIKEHLAQ
ncbi:hypothetical protein BDB00DRAFT_789647 [Zychaea mexicana]|uniref:uncharacterized protein n=1 Tax=Zychaea mexicana TaxID=64656 RepID=UPI0022FF1892|nr:uncharacterized protein BDB00DRAFT_930548 [Zychaea mexicana]XP_052977509.1 uncharacterized protein BDB00DRAFT_789647 [Zychaea mexicana]KAI9491238.1 hypothetical protein BDB00DRAFT_930548 [Zychaea mexicana]KAI9491244.1 hypothetical protein BDB00DRAFT_789647 [Zychaea mexicana]